jgi:hypothetical protein
MNLGAYRTSPGGAGSESHNNKSSLLISFKKEESSFLKKRYCVVGQAPILIERGKLACLRKARFAPLRGGLWPGLTKPCQLAA